MSLYPILSLQNYRHCYFKRLSLHFPVILIPISLEDPQRSALAVPPIHATCPWSDLELTTCTFQAQFVSRGVDGYWFLRCRMIEIATSYILKNCYSKSNRHVHKRVLFLFIPGSNSTSFVQELCEVLSFTSKFSSISKKMVSCFSSLQFLCKRRLPDFVVPCKPFSMQ